MTAMIERPQPRVGRDDLLGAVAALEPTIRACASQAEMDRTLPLDCVEAMRAAQLFAIAAPRDVGGLEVDPVTHLEIIEAVARLDTSAGWTLMIGAHGAGMIGAFAPDEACDRVFSGPRWPIAGSQMAPWAGSFRTVEGGVSVNGRWSFASGIRHADWSMFTARANPSTSAQPVELAGVIPAAEVDIHDNWHVSGLKGTGSCDYSLADAFVPTGMTWQLPHQVLRGGPRYRLKMPQATLAAFALGVARRSLDEIIEQSAAKVRPGYPNPVAHRSFFHHVIGEAEMQLAAARAGLFTLVEQLWQLAIEDAPIPTELDLRLVASPAYVHSVASAITSTAFRFAGSGASRLDNVLQRNLRDMAVAAQHMQAGEQHFETLGRSLVGVRD